MSDHTQFDVRIIEREPSVEETHRAGVHLAADVHVQTEQSFALVLEVTEHSLGELHSVKAVREDFDHRPTFAHSLGDTVGLAHAHDLVQSVEQLLKIQDLTLQVLDHPAFGVLLVNAGGVGAATDAAAFERKV